MIDMFSYRLGKKASGSSGGSSVGWTTKNANNTVAVIESLPEEIMIYMDSKDTLDYWKFEINRVRLVYLPEDEDFLPRYEGYCTILLYDDTKGESYPATGYICIELDSSEFYPDVMNFSGNRTNLDYMLEKINFGMNLDDVKILAYKGTPIEVATITFNLNGATYNTGAGMTWLEWTNSQYNTDGYYCDTDNGYVYDSYGGYIVESESGAEVEMLGVIQSGGTYYTY